MRIIDLSAPIVAGPPEAAPFERVEIKYTSHAEGAAQVQAMLGVPPHLLRHGEGWAIEEFTRLGTHSVTHVDAPWHYNSTIQGQPAATIDELPLEWFFGDGLVLDMTAKADGERIDVTDVEAALATIHHALEAARHRAAADRPRRLLRAGRTTRCGAVPSCPRRPAGCTSAASGSWGSTPGAGTGRSIGRRKRRSPGRSRGSSGRRISATCRTRKSSGW